jgi:4-oxalocrotonate tautomerase
MPLIHVKVLEGVFSPGQKQEIVKKLTDAMGSIKGDSFSPLTWVVVEDVASGQWEIRGKQLPTEFETAFSAC